MKGPNFVSSVVGGLTGDALRWTTLLFLAGLGCGGAASEGTPADEAKDASAAPTDDGSFDTSVADAIDAAVTPTQPPSNPDVRLLDASEGGVPVCVATNVQLLSSPPEVLLVLDRSGSMRRDALGLRSTPDKWQQTLSALDSSLASTQGNIFWGLKMYPSWQKEGDNACATAGLPVVAPALGQHDLIISTATAKTPVLDRGSTPTAQAITEAVETLRARTTQNRKFLLLATDGLPNCRDGLDRDEDSAGAIASIANARVAGYPTFVLGIAIPDVIYAGTNSFAVLNQLAEAGGRPRSGNVKFYSATNTQELVQALNTITGQVSECTFSLSSAPPNPQNVTLVLDGQNVQQSEWSYGEGNLSIILKGSWCSKLKAGDVKQATLKVGC